MIIAFEGGDRCGKTTQIEILKNKIEEMIPSIKVMSLKHPNRSTSSGKIIDAFLKKTLKLNNEAITLCLTSNLWETSEVIKDHLRKGYTILIDRYIHTNLVYSQLRGIELGRLQKLMDGILKPNIVIYLKPKSAGIDSSSRTDFGLERYETTEFQSQVCKKYDELFENHDESINVIEVDSSASVEEVEKEIWFKINKLI